MSDNVYQMNSRRRPSNYDGGGHGGDMDNLTKRVEQLEKDTHKIQLDLAVLTTRSEEFATKSGLAELAARFEDVAPKSALGNFECATKSALAELSTRCNEFATKGDLHKEISGQTKWIAATIIGVAALCMTAAKFLF
ncbi:hypothetical protein [Serratia liquefaciens]|uniref:DUF1640 domain-containing protein n=1 Tax=Serratia liquefaciens TaxID=614 RepID=A0ABX7DBF1_SERLI|nr:hypothetical protein [Serratia liquefaciens]QQU57932.1 hypothetical protein I6I38_05445 [Serratia liquefaciens]